MPLLHRATTPYRIHLRYKRSYTISFPVRTGRLSLSQHESDYCTYTYILCALVNTMQVNELWNWVHLMVKYLAHTHTKFDAEIISQRESNARVKFRTRVLCEHISGRTARKKNHGKKSSNTKKKNWRKTTNKWVLLCKCSAKVDVNDAICRESLKYFGWFLYFIFRSLIYTIYIYYFYFCFV